jgi:hypothetical protein
MVAAKILNKQSRTADKGLSSSLGVGLTTPHRKKIRLLRNVKKGLGLGPCEQGNEPSGSIKCSEILQ